MTRRAVESMLLSGKAPSNGWKQRVASLPLEDGDVRLHYIDCPPSVEATSSGTLLLIHGFPQTSYQFRHVITPLAGAGYRVIAPDYRGAGESSKPASGFTKTRMAEDLRTLMIHHLGVQEKIHLVGHDIGGMVAHAYASRHPDEVASIIWGECPLPGTAIYEADKALVAQFHFTFHSVHDLPEALVAGREGIYLKHFFDKLLYNRAAITPLDLDLYTLMYSQPGAIRCAFEVYRAFEMDAEENRAWLREHGKCPVPAAVFSGERSRHAPEAESMAKEVYECVEVAMVEDSGHYLAEENPEDFVKKVLAFIRTIA